MGFRLFVFRSGSSAMRCSSAAQQGEGDHLA
jgi:hypothetical protein